MSSVKFKEAQALFKAKKYKDTIAKCSELVNENTDKKDAFLLAAKAYLFMLNTPADGAKNQTILAVFNNSCSEARSIEEVLELERDMISALYAWKEKTILSNIKALENNPTLQNWSDFFRTIPEYIKFSILIQMTARNCRVISAYCEENGIQKKELARTIQEKYGNKYYVDDKFDKLISNYLYDAAKTIFDNAKLKLSENADGNSDFIKQLAKVITEKLLTAECIASYTSEVKGLSQEVLCSRLKLNAEITEYILSAKIYPNGQCMSLYMGNNRMGKTEKLRELYNEIKGLDSSFEIPDIPEAEAIVPSAPAKTSGGCYVATAVYGSYDCPQVWTLRRFRDYTLAKTWYGRAFIRIYYAISPVIVKWFGNTNWFKKIWKGKLDRMVEELNKKGVEDTPYNDRVW